MPRAARPASTLEPIPVQNVEVKTYYKLYIDNLPTGNSAVYLTKITETPDASAPIITYHQCTLTWAEVAAETNLTPLCLISDKEFASKSINDADGFSVEMV